MHFKICVAVIIGKHSVAQSGCYSLSCHELQLIITPSADGARHQGCACSPASCWHHLGTGLGMRARGMAVGLGSVWHSGSVPVLGTAGCGPAGQLSSALPAQYLAPHRALSPWRPASQSHAISICDFSRHGPLAGKSLPLLAFSFLLFGCWTG